MKKQDYPKCIYKEGEGKKDAKKVYKIVKSPQEEKKQLEAWGLKKPEKQKTGERGLNPDRMKVEDLKAELIKNHGFEESDLEGLKRDQLIELLKNIESEQ